MGLVAGLRAPILEQACVERQFGAAADAAQIQNSEKDSGRIRGHPPLQSARACGKGEASLAHSADRGRGEVQWVSLTSAD